MTDREAIEGKIADLKTELARVEGRPTEVYSRIVGYYRSVRNWNAGKREEYGHRVAFRMPGTGDPALLPPTEGIPAARPATGDFDFGGGAAAGRPAAERPSTEVRGRSAAERSGILVFTRKACPSCPPVKDWIAGSGLPAVQVDVDSAEGMSLARRHGIQATPTVLGLDAEGRESFRAHGLAELRATFASATPPA